MSRYLVTAPPATPAPPGHRIFTAEHIPCEQVSCEPVWERREEWRVGEAEEAEEAGEAGESGSMLVANSKVESAFLRAYNYIALVPQRPSSATMADLHAKCFRSCSYHLWHVLHFNITVARKARDGNLP